MQEPFGKLNSNIFLSVFSKIHIFFYLKKGAAIMTRMVVIFFKVEKAQQILSFKADIFKCFRPNWTEAGRC